MEREGEWDSEGIKELAAAYHGVNNKFRAQKAVYRMKKIIQANRAKTKSNFVHLMTDIQLKVRSDGTPHKFRGISSKAFSAHSTFSFCQGTITRNAVLIRAAKKIMLKAKLLG